MTHAELVAVAIRWLRNRHRCAIVFSEWAPSSISEIPDAIGFDRGGRSILVECKASRSDFRADAHKPSMRGAGRVGLRRWYLTPADLVQPAEVPEGWGLAVARASRAGPRVSVLREPTIATSRNVRAELALLAAAVWRHENGVPWRPEAARFDAVPPTAYLRPKASPG